MIQQQTFALDNATRRRLLDLAAAIRQHKDDRALVCKLIAEQDEIMKHVQTKIYDPQAEARWA